jgi:hypothetical protein
MEQDGGLKDPPSQAGDFMQNMTDVMFDLETFGKAPGCALRSIGAVFFDVCGNFGPEFYRNIERQSCLDAGLKVDPETEKWWADQTKASQDALLVNPRPLREVVLEFANWFKAKGGERVWCQGATFDAPVWDAACAALGQKVPWKFWNVRDTRTAYDLYNFDPRSVNREGTYHNALDDAKHQAVCIQTAVLNCALKSL